MQWLIGTTGQSFLDTSTIIHLCFWIFMGSCTAYAKTPIRYAMAGMLVLAYAWEVFERYAEKKWPQLWLHPESWHNAYISDVLAGFLGVWLAYWLVSKQ